MAQELALVQVPRHRGAVDFDEGPFRPLAAPMDLPRDTTRLLREEQLELFTDEIRAAFRSLR